jgi:hypothetical protein
MLWRRWVAITVVLNLELLSPAAEASLEAARRALRAFDFAQAAALFGQARVAGGNPYERYVAILEGLGIAQASLGNGRAADEAFDLLLAIAPGHAIQYTLSPKVTFVFERARRRHAKSAPIMVQLNWSLGREVNQPIPVSIMLLSDPLDLLRNITLYADRPGLEVIRRTLALREVDRELTVLLPAPAPPVRSAGVMLLRLSGYDAHGNEIVRVGSAALPRRVPLSYRPQTPWYRKWWVWTAAAAVLSAGVGTSVWLATRPPPEQVDVELDVGFGP